MLKPNSIFLNAALVVTALSTTVACGEPDLIMPIGDTAPKAEAVEIESETTHEALTASYLLAPQVQLNVEIRQQEDQLIQVTYGPEVLFKQRLNYDGVVTELQLGTVSVSLNEENEIDPIQALSVQDQLENCYDRRVRCFMAAMEALAALKKANPEAFASVNGENAVIGLEAITKAADLAVPLHKVSTAAPAKPLTLPELPFLNLGLK